MATEASGEAKESIPVGGERVSSLVHDLRHCLHVIRLGIELLRDAPDEEKRAELCRTMEAEDRKASQLLEELLTALGHGGSRK